MRKERSHEPSHGGSFQAQIRLAAASFDGVAVSNGASIRRFVAFDANPVGSRPCHGEQRRLLHAVGAANAPKSCFVLFAGSASKVVGSVPPRHTLARL